MKTKLFCSAAALLILSSSVLSCGEAASAPSADTNAGNTPGTEAETAELTYLDTMGEKDFGGASFKYICPENTLVKELNVHSGALTGDAMNDAQYLRDQQLEERFNVKIEYPRLDSPSTSVKNSVLAGDSIADVYIDSLCDGSCNMGPISTQGLLYNLLEVPYLQLDKEWWSPLMYKNLQYKGKMFYTSGDIAPFSYIGPACIYMNLKLSEDFDVPENDIYQAVYDGKWTFDMLYSYTHGIDQDLNGDGKMHCLDDFYGIVNEYNNLTSSLLLVACGLHLCDYDPAKDALTVDLGTTKVVEAVDKMASQFVKINNNGDNTLMFDQTFKNDRALFALHYTESTLRRFRDMNSDYVILPMPKLDEAQESYVSYINPWVYAFVSVPLVQENIEKTGFIIEAMEYLSVEDVRPAVYEITLKGKALRNQDSLAMLDLVFDTTYIDFCGIYEFGGVIGAVNNAMFNKKPYLSSYEKVKPKVDKALEDFAVLFEESGN